MADLTDLASEIEQRATEASISKALHKPMPTGRPGECDLCGEYFARLVDGACGFCRDKWGLP